MDWSSNGLNISANSFVLLVFLIWTEVIFKYSSGVSVCKTNKLKTNCNPDSLSFLWSIKRSPPDPPGPPSPPSYFFGTIHVPYSRVWDSIPNRVKLAFKTSDSIFFELDLMDAYTVSTLSNCQLLPKGVRLIDILPIDLYRRLKRHLDYIRLMLPTWMTPDQKARGLYAEYLYNAITGNWERKRPVWVMLMVNSLTENDIKSRGIPVLDLYLAQEAQRLNKHIGSVEKVEEQCIPLNGLNFSQVVFALNQTLYQHEGIRRGVFRSKLTTDDLIRHYNCGDLNELIFNSDTTHVPNIKNNSHFKSREDLELAKHIDDYFRSELIVKRNKRMSQRVLNILKSNPNQSFFFAFGAGHFLGNDSILDFIRENGFEINKVSDLRTKRLKLRCRSHQNRHKFKNKFKSESIFSEQMVPQKNSRNLKKVDSKQNNLIFMSNKNNKRESDGSVVSTSDEKSMPYLISPSVQSTSIRERLSLHTSNANAFPTSSATTTSSSLFSPHYSSLRQPNRKFNDLWVRLETTTTKTPLLMPRQEMAKDDRLVSNYMWQWYSSGSGTATTTSSSTQLTLFCSHSTNNLILISYIYTIILLISHSKALLL